MATRRARKAASKKTAMKRGSRYGCNVCGMVVTVDELCGCVDTCDIICCGQGMAPRGK